ncbi:hypothetical protein [Pseudomonas costantinii]|uniref:DUF3509 domain-containing protein n=1 Tax=Pseudomonas costantinii TaxID=168469 RepID=A0A1H5IYL4_9PSED|nr:hypothetical protein [Pseudomonas costantinii]NVZ18951.1 hypothetical protein [Pseudomonas costantinii]SEE45137.1 hypothetical protein SAMN04515675_5618 [Pseudomonas costantinii]
MNLITLKQLRTAAENDDVDNVVIKAQGGIFVIQIHTRNGENATLSKARKSELRNFTNSTQALGVLHQLGLALGQFDIESWNPNDKSACRTRPDRTKALKFLLEAAKINNPPLYRH